MQDKIIIKGAKVHNLKNVSLDIPKNKITVFSGVSGSGKSSLAFDTIFAEGQRRYIESLSPYARQFLGQMKSADVEEIVGLSPAIAIDQKALSHNPRSTVGTLTEIYDYLRILFARTGEVFCPQCDTHIARLSADEMVDIIIEQAAKAKEKHVTLLSPIVRSRKGEYYQMLYDYLGQGYGEVRVDGKMYSLSNKIKLERNKKHTIDLIVDKVLVSDKSRLAEAVEDATDHSKGLVIALFKETEKLLSSSWTCPEDSYSFPEIEPRLFSFNSPTGACPDCKGLGKIGFWKEAKTCARCEGKRLQPAALAVRIGGKNIQETSSLTIAQAQKFFQDYKKKLDKRKLLVAENVIKEINDRLNFLLEVGLDYLTLTREAETLSGGEAQRIRLASQIGSKLSNTLYVLDEPTIGLHERDTDRLIKTLIALRDMHNTVLVVEHDEQTIKSSDHLVDLGPQAGRHGGEIVYQGDTKTALTKDAAQKNKDSLTLQYLNGTRQITTPPKRRKKSTPKIAITGASAHNLKDVRVDIPTGKLVCVTGVSGSGKSTLLYDVLYKNIIKLKNRDQNLEDVTKITGTEYVDKIVIVNQSPIGRTPRSNPATYTGIFTPIREFYSSLEESRTRGYKPGRFSFNVEGGRCEACKGAGANLVEMHFLPPVLVPCNVCKSKRFNRETLQVLYKKKNISQVLNMTVNESLPFFKDIYTITDKLKVLQEVGLGYLKLGQSATTLSGGEAQRIKLGRELTAPLGQRTMYLLDEPTVGLHYYDMELLLKVLNKLVDKRNTVILIEHNLHIIKSVDYVIDLGPEGGEQGGRVVAYGTPEEVARSDRSYTGLYLKEYL
ncbi:MAG: excinuclease ABC subunit UvrA [Parcubacteria group bacterium]